MAPREHLDPDPVESDYVIGVNTTANEHMPLLRISTAQTMLTLLFLNGRWNLTDHIFFAPPTYVVASSSVDVMPD